MKKLLTLLFIISFIILPLSYAPQAIAATPLTVTGMVIDRHGNPIAGANVQLINDQFFGSSYQILGTTTTDSNGNFEFINVPSSSALVKVIMTVTENGKTYTNKNQLNDYNWVDASQTILRMPTSETKLTSYPPPDYGYLWGLMQQEGSNPRPLANGVVYVMSGEQRYYTFTSDGVNGIRGAYSMKLPVGTYSVYGQYMENGILYQSKIISNVNVIGVDKELDANPLAISMPMSSPASNAVPSSIPGIFSNTVNGTVMFQDNTGIPGITVSLWQSTDGNANSFLKKAEATTDANGFYQFNDVRVTSDPPENAEVYARKDYRVSATYVDTDGIPHVQNYSFSLYHPNVILGSAKAEESARNVTADLKMDYSMKGWIKIQCDPNNAKVFVDGQPLMGPDGNQLTTPCTAYIPAGSHTIRLSATGYADKEYPVIMVANQQTMDLTAHLDKPIVPPWVVPASAVLILLIAAGLILALLVSKRHMFTGPMAGVLAPLNRTIGSMRSSGEARKARREAQKARAAELKKAEQAHRAQMADASPLAKQKLDGRKSEPERSFAATEQPRLPEHAGEVPSMVSARDIYRKVENADIERVPHGQATGNTGKSASFGGYDMPPRAAPAREKPITAEPDGRIRVPKAAPPARDQPTNNVKDKERVIRYIRDHPDGISFIQMSNELEIPPNTLTIITKELVINDDIEKVKGLYYYKTHDTSPDESKSSVVVWRLDGED
ncbi:MAG: PEGA domain protein [Methanocella sp. PtaU1.Bin125]|nr:MAG: PEGA domain protein [Methanocella sp. PtaU1.Bin125]